MFRTDPDVAVTASRPVFRSCLLGLLLAVTGCATGDGTDGGSTENGVQTCNGPDAGMPGPVSTCAAAEQCDGVIDENCNGIVDENCGRCPLMTVACPSGCCAIDSRAVGTAASNGAEIAVEPSGTIYFAYTKPTSGAWKSTLAIYNPVPGTWREVALGGGTYRNRIRIDAMGRVHVANASSSEPRNITYRRSDDHGVTFTAPVTVGVLTNGGTFDMEVDHVGQPHLAYEGVSPSSSLGNLRYTHLVGTTWTTEILDAMTQIKDHPDLELGFADRPHIVFEALNPPGVSGQAKRYVFHNGNRWIEETFDVTGTQASYPGDHYFVAQSLRINADDSRDVLFMRRTGVADDKLMLAHRGPLDSDTWQLKQVTGATGITTPTMFIDHNGKRGAVSDGVRVHREQSATAWTTTMVGGPGHGVASARRGRYLYLGYSADAALNGPPTVKVIDLGP
jgi:hypothetical protein